MSSGGNGAFISLGLIVLCLSGVAVLAVQEEDNRPAVVTTRGPQPTKGAGGVDRILDGMQVIGEDMPPGIWRATAGDIGCYWERRTGTGGTADQVITNGLGDPGKEITIEIKKTDKAFFSSGCGQWRKIQ